MNHTMKLQPEYFDRIVAGEKTIEVRLFDAKRQTIQVGDTIEFHKVSEPRHAILTKVEGLTVYPSFAELIKNFSPAELGADHQIILQDLKRFYSGSDEQKFGVVAIKVALKAV